MTPNLPNHIAVIPDGNRRWAKARNLEPWIGHEHGAKTVKQIVKDSFGLGIKYFTFWAMSEDNIKKRNTLEVKFLFKLIGKIFEDFEKDSYTHDNQINVDFLGSWEQMFPEDVKEILYQIKEKTKNYNKHFLTFLLAYDGKSEMLKTIEKFSKENPNIKPTPELIKNYSCTKNLPAVDLVVRTGGEPHWSAGFMMWDVADSQLYFTETLWPDFNKKELETALGNFAKTKRKLGA
ncbi:MAG: polyprenyl diphosphate synthase [bacterium]|nr:polyprenyl diphosphate synthase [bacterium]